MRAWRKGSKWAVGFGSVGKKKKKEKCLSEQKGVRCAQQGLTVSHRHDLLAHWALYLLWIADPWCLGVVHSKSSRQWTIQCHHIWKCQWRYIESMRIVRIFTVLYEFSSILKQVLHTKWFNKCSNNVMSSLPPEVSLIILIYLINFNSLMCKVRIVCSYIYVR